MDARSPNQDNDRTGSAPGPVSPEAGQEPTCVGIHPSPAHPIMFWVLVSLALLIFAPCVLVPIGVEGQRLRDYETTLQATVSALEEQLARTRAQADALLADPLVNERILRRELNYRPDDEEIIHWAAEELAAVQPEPETVEATRPPSTQPAQTSVPLASLKHWLPDWPYRDLFAKSPQRLLLLAMAGGMLMAAFLLYAPVRPPADPDCK